MKLRRCFVGLTKSSSRHTKLKKRNQGASKFQPDHVLLVLSKWDENKIAPFTLEEKSFMSRGHVQYQYVVTMWSLAHCDKHLTSPKIKKQHCNIANAGTNAHVSSAGLVFWPRKPRVQRGMAVEKREGKKSFDRLGLGPKGQEGPSCPFSPFS